jgi:hypothetical protein
MSDYSGSDGKTSLEGSNEISQGTNKQLLYIDPRPGMLMVICEAENFAGASFLSRRLPRNGPDDLVMFRRCTIPCE